MDAPEVVMELNAEKVQELGLAEEKELNKIYGQRTPIVKERGDERTGKIYEQVTVCETDVKRILTEKGYAPTKENADKVGYSNSVQSQWHENDVSAWATVIECGIEEMKDELKRLKPGSAWPAQQAANA
jgi:hypothetical protein